MGIIIHYIIPSLYIYRAIIIETYKQVRCSPAEAVAEGKRRDLPYTHFLAAVGTQGFFLGNNFF
jgi:hypothetical protein